MANHSTRLSIIVPVYNVLPYVQMAIESAISIPNAEVICIDDGSTDGSGLVLEELKRECQDKGIGCVKVVHQLNAGVSAARNAGLKIALGEWVTFLDGDDILIADGVGRAMAFAHENDLDFCSFNHEGEGRAVGGVEYGRCLVAEAPDDMRTVCGVQYLNAWGAVYRRYFLIDNGVEFPVGIANNEDFVFLARVFALSPRVGFVNRFGYRVTEREGSSSRSGRTPQKYLSMMRAGVLVSQVLCFNRLFVSHVVMEWAAENINCEIFQHWDLVRGARGTDVTVLCVVLKETLTSYLSTFNNFLDWRMYVILLIVRWRPRALFIKPYVLMLCIKWLRRSNRILRKVGKG